MDKFWIDVLLHEPEISEKVQVSCYVTMVTIYFQTVLDFCHYCSMGVLEEGEL